MVLQKHLTSTIIDLLLYVEVLFFVAIASEVYSVLLRIEVQSVQLAQPVLPSRRSYSVAKTGLAQGTRAHCVHWIRVCVVFFRSYFEIFSFRF